MKTTRTLALGGLLAAMLAAISLTATPSVTGQAPAPDKVVVGQQLDNRWAPNPIHHTLQTQAQELIQQYVKTEKEDEKKDIRKKLTEILDRQFDLHMKEQGKEIDELEKQVAKLKSLLKKRKDAKENIVERRLEQLIQEAEGLGWNAPGRGRNFSPYGFGEVLSAPSMRPLKH